jgi:hypothetical protein
MPHCCCMSSRITTILVLFFMDDDLCFTDVVCLVEFRLFMYCLLWLISYASLVLYVYLDYCCIFSRITTIFFYCFLWLIIYASLMLYDWSDYDYFVLFPLNDNSCFTGVVCLVRLRLLLCCSLWLILYASLVLYV